MQPCRPVPGEREPQARQHAAVLGRRHGGGAAAREHVAAKALVRRIVAQRLAHDRIAALGDERGQRLRNGVMVEVFGKTGGGDIVELGATEPRREVGEGEQVPVLVQEFMGEVGPVLLTHAVELLFRGWIGGEIMGMDVCACRSRGPKDE